MLYFKCCSCEQVFICSEQLSIPETLICGSGCGGTVWLISEDEALKIVDRLRESMNYGR